MKMNKSNETTHVPVELLARYDKPGPRYTSYPTAPIWSNEVGPNDYEDALRRASVNHDAPLSVYCHIPFCKKRCYYCGCTTFIASKPAAAEPYVDLVCKEIIKTAGLLHPRKKIATLHFGGGTPTFAGTPGLGKIIDTMDEHFKFVQGCEKSIEVDPRVTTPEQLDYLASRGFNRISIGVQDLNPEVQKASGRVQTDEQVMAILNKSRELGFKGINIDLIYGLPLQTVEGFTETLKRVIDLKPDRLAVYSFAFLPDLKANQQKIKKEELPTTNEKYALFSAAIEQFTGAGYRQIGMDHFALPTDELAIAQEDGRLYRNFMGYSVQSAPDMIGLGMSSIGYVDNGFYQNHSKLNSYKEMIADDNFSVFRGMKLSDDDLMRQYVITHLMCNFRMNFSEFHNKFGIKYSDYFANEHDGLTQFVDDKFMEICDVQLTVTPLGRTFVRNIAMTYDAYLSGSEGGKKATFSRTI